MNETRTREKTRWAVIDAQYGYGVIENPMFWNAMIPTIFSVMADDGEGRMWHGIANNDRDAYDTALSSDQIHEIKAHLQKMRDLGFFLISWGGVAFLEAIGDVVTLDSHVDLQHTLYADVGCLLPFHAIDGPKQDMRMLAYAWIGDAVPHVNRAELPWLGLEAGSREMQDVVVVCMQARIARLRRTYISLLSADLLCYHIQDEGVYEWTPMFSLDTDYFRPLTVNEVCEQYDGPIESIRTRVAWGHIPF